MGRPHAGKRLIEALRTLSRLPAPQGPQQFGSAWPAYFHGWEDQLAQQEMESDQRELIERAKNRIKVLPSSIEIMRMESAIAWPMRYVGELPQLLRAVQIVALGRSRHRDLEWAARRLRFGSALVRRWNREGLDMIARGLLRDRVPIF